VSHHSWTLAPRLKTEFGWSSAKPVLRVVTKVYHKLAAVGENIVMELRRAVVHCMCVCHGYVCDLFQMALSG